MATEHEHQLLIGLIRHIEQFAHHSPIFLPDKWLPSSKDESSVEWKVEWERDAALKGVWLSLNRGDL